MVTSLWPQLTPQICVPQLDQTTMACGSIRKRQEQMEKSAFSNLRHQARDVLLTVVFSRISGNSASLLPMTSLIESSHPESREGSPKLLIREQIGPSIQSFRATDGSPSRASAEKNQESAEEQQETMVRGRNTRMKSLAEISCSKLVIGRSGRRSNRVPRKMLNTGEKSSTPPVNEVGSGMDLHDSQIANMNHVFCNQDPNPERMEPSPTPDQIWRFLAQIGVKGNVAVEEMVHRIQTMEQRDLKSFLETMEVQNKARVEEGGTIKGCPGGGVQSEMLIVSRLLDLLSILCCTKLSAFCKGVTLLAEGCRKLLVELHLEAVAKFVEKRS
ncbi:hypothetical protein Ancab_023108 [Ancistrocladus abbreviatus]